jgi:hypothetical protein
MKVLSINFYDVKTQKLVNVPPSLDADVTLDMKIWAKKMTVKIL